MARICRTGLSALPSLSGVNQIWRGQPNSGGDDPPAGIESFWKGDSWLFSGHRIVSLTEHNQLY
jgi:hypothetical protein